MASRPRAELSKLLRETLGNDHVYFQPPESVKMEYPAIIYTLSDIDPMRADNLFYGGKRQYQVTLITRDPDAPQIDEIAAFPLCSFDRWYAADNLNHYVYSLYF